MSILDEHLAEAVKLYGVTADAILGPSRYQVHVAPRRYVMRALREQGWSFPQIGRAFNRDHTTAMALVNTKQRIRTPSKASDATKRHSDPRRNAIEGSAALRDACLALLARRLSSVGT